MLPDTLKAMQLRQHGYVHDPKFHDFELAKMPSVCKATFCEILPKFKILRLAKKRYLHSFICLLCKSKKESAWSVRLKLYEFEFAKRYSVNRDIFFANARFHILGQAWRNGTSKVTTTDFVLTEKDLF